MKIETKKLNGTETLCVVRNTVNGKRVLSEIVNLTKDEAKAKFGAELVKIEAEFNGTQNAEAKMRDAVRNMLGAYCPHSN